MARRPFVRLADDISADSDLDGLRQTQKCVAIGTFASVLGYCHRERTDGLVSARQWAKLGSLEGRRLLLRLGWVQANGSGYVVPNYLRWQQSRAESEAASAAGRKANT